MVLESEIPKLLPWLSSGAVGVALVLATLVGIALFFSYLIALPTALGALMLRAAGVTPGWMDVWALMELESLAPFLPGRLVSAAMGTATVAVVYRTGAAFVGRRAGLAAAALLAVSPLHVQWSALALPEAAMTFWAACALHAALAALRDRSVEGDTAIPSA